jgi:glyceraldehyde-3-phosphate dehydrogenase (NADP+)
VSAIALGGFGYAGQSCISVQRIFVHAPVYDAFRARFLEHVRTQVRWGDPRLRETVVGPMIDPAAVERTLKLIAEATTAGAKVLTGGRAQGGGRFLEPTVLEQVPAQLPICAGEVFAPVVTLHSYERFDEALAQVNDSVFGLQTGVFTQNLPRVLHAFSSLAVGGVLINDVPTFRVENMPYGGIKDSGFGREGIRYAMEEMTEIRSLMIKL